MRSTPIDPFLTVIIKRPIILRDKQAADLRGVRPLDPFLTVITSGQSFLRDNRLQIYAEYAD
ncbi:MAG TPA: hypothetical protein VGK99_15240 [Acidobacteriota bacterium]